jgi:hypothetical protein
MVRGRLLVAVAGAALGLFCPTTLAESSFESCGTLVAGAECVLFRADADGSSYVLANRGAFVVGDRVRVIGLLNTGCITSCQQGSGCIEDNSIEACPPEIDACGVLVQGAECPLLQPDGELRTYVVENLGGFAVGDRVRVTGTRDSACLSTCGASSGCIVANTIRAADSDCPPATPVCALAALGLPVFVSLLILGLRGVMASPHVD